MRKGKPQKGQFDVKPGMAFTMWDMPQLIDDKSIKDADRHLWLITDVYDDFVEIVMCNTMDCYKEGKHYKGTWNDDVTEDILNPCPPMDKPSERTSGVSVDTFMTLTKKELFSHKLQILNENTKTCNFKTQKMDSLCMDAKQLTVINNQINVWLSKNQAYDYDRRGCHTSEIHLDQLNEGKEVPEGFTYESYDKQFAWNHLPKADPRMVYPFEDTMHDYEKRDTTLVRIVRQRDNNGPTL